MRVLGVIPARGGSKGVPRKNICLVGGKPLLQYTVEAALKARLLSRLIISTDDEQIADVGRKCGAEVPYLRPHHLALDETPTLPVIQHAMGWLEERGDRFDALCLLQPTHPLRQAEDIDACIDLLREANVDSVATVIPVPDEHNPHWVYFRTPDGLLVLSTGEETPIARRQELPPAFHREGSVYVVRRDVVMIQASLYGRRLVGYPLRRERSINVDHPEDLIRLERTLALPSRGTDADKVAEPKDR
ncbi:MAG: acylneuraminate cytidylyltransferase family protein [Acidobacteria bacterium]|nr:acylneuraminate cytidylyltransferase family protein [Acidobacteriota bacterium]